MKKVYAEIIAGVIPHKMTRNRWRGLLRFGIMNVFKLKRKIEKTTPRLSEFLTVCAIAKDEGPYFKEWLDWHIAQGVDKFYIYDNESKDCTRDVLKPYIEKGIVEYSYFPGEHCQLAAYDDCLQRHRFDARWIAFIDLDEFVVPIKDKSFAGFIKRFENFSVVEINWLVYGSNGHEKKSAEPVMKRFTRHSLPDHILNRHVKSVVNPLKIATMTGCHEAARLSGKAADSHGDVIRRNFRERTPQQDVIRINHYAVRSLEEFHEKQMRGRAAGRTRFIDMTYFNRFDLNDIPD